MQRPHVLGLLAALILVGAAAVFLWNGHAAPPPPPPTTTGDTDPGAAPATATTDAGALPVADSAARREAALPARSGIQTLDPDVRAALTGFKGRVVDHRQQPVADCGVRIYRGAMDMILPLDGDLFADPDQGAPPYEPRYVAGETRTDAEGRFVIDGVWPRGFYLLLAGIDTDAPTHRVLSRSPDPGEIVDLGDVVLNDAAVVTGTVVDEDGAPVADALVRGVDLPGQMLGFFPLERFDPEGALLVREPGSPVQVVEMPPWVARAFEHLPIPSTRSGPDGSFRLAGLVPGSNVIATTKRGHLADVRSGVLLKPGQTKALGRVQLRFGEELRGRVLDTAGKPVAGAEVLAGSTIMIAPVDLALRVGTTDAEGRFRAEGFSAGKITVAARRTGRDPWVLADPQPIFGDVVVTLPALAGLTVRVTGPGGDVVKEPELRVVPCARAEEAAVMGIMGVVRPVDLKARCERLEDGRVRVRDLPAARYVVFATSKDLAMACAEADLRQGGDVDVAVALPERKTAAVRVLDPAGEPLRSAAVYVQERGDGALRQMPFLAGHTDREGRVTVKQTSATQLRVSAEHPRYGAVHGQCKAGDPEVVLQMQEPGWIEGVLTDHGKPPEAGKYTVSAEWRPETRGATEMVPLLATPGLDGKFVLRALQPGQYSMEVINSLDVLTSPGGFMTFAQGMFMQSSGLPHESVQVVSGQGAQVTLDVGEDEYTGPTGRVFGSATVDGRLASGWVLRAWTKGGQRVARVDSAGRFDFGDVPAGSVQLNLVEGGDLMMFERRGIANRTFELAAGEQREVVFDLRTTQLSGTVLLADGTPASNVHVSGGASPTEKTEDGGSHRVNAVTDADGRFRIERAPVGVYWLEARTRGQEPMRGRLEGIVADGAGPVTDLRLQLTRTPVVSGRIDVSTLPSKPEWMWVSFHRENRDRPGGVGDQVDGEGVQSDGAFSTSDLGPGTYLARVHLQVGEQWKEYSVVDPIVVPAGGVSGLVLRLVPQ